MTNIFSAPWRRRGTILSLLGALFVIIGVFFWPMFIITGGMGGYRHDEWSEWTMLNVFIQMAQADQLDTTQMGMVFPLFALPMLTVVLILVTSITLLFRELPVWLMYFRSVAAIFGLIFQVMLVALVYVAIALSDATEFGVGAALTFIGLLVMIVGTFLE